MRVIVLVRGGICQAVYADGSEPVDVMIVDQDNMLDGDCSPAEFERYTEAEQLMTSADFREVF